jgi:diaminobutyrate-2-oxoglutarate transaminase
MGDYFIKEVRKLQEEYGFVGDVRGQGLFIGIEIVKDNLSKTPDAELAKKLKQGLQERGVLTSITGNYACVIRLTPPLTINKSHIGEVIEALRGTIKSL